MIAQVYRAGLVGRAGGTGHNLACAFVRENLVKTF